MTRTNLLAASCVVAIPFVCSSPALAQTEIGRSVIGAGGGTVSTGPLTISCAIGQPFAGPAAAQTSGIYAGFWTTVPSPFCQADFNQDGNINSQDFFDFITPFFGQQPSADFNRDGFVNSQDFFDFLTAFFIGCP